MQKLLVFFAGVLVALMSMPPHINLLAPIGGNLDISLMPPTLTLGMLLGVKTVAQNFGQTRRLLSNTNWYLLIFLLMASFSVLWSNFPMVTIARLYRMYAIFFICFGFSLVSWDAQKFDRTVRPALLFVTLGSIIFYFFSPSNAVEESMINGRIQLELVDAWRGISMHKNTLGAISSVGAIIFFHALYTGNGSRIGTSIGFICSLICLLKSRSSTSLFSALFALSLIVLVLKSPSVEKRRTIRIFSSILLALFLVYSLGVLNVVPGLSAIVEPIVSMTGKDMTFSGRTVIWDILKNEIAKHPLLGSGYASFWLGSDPMSPSAIFKSRMYFDPGEAHNGYLDILNELGFIGILALIGYITTFLRQSIFLLAFNRQKSALFIGLLFAQLIANMSEAHWWRISSVNFYIMTLATFDLARSVMEAKQKKRGGNARSVQSRAQPLNRTTVPGRRYSVDAPPLHSKTP